MARRTGGRFTVIDARMRDAVEARLEYLGLGIKAREIDASRNTVRKVLNADPGESVNVGILARMLRSLEMTPADVTALGYPGVAHEMERQENEPPDEFTNRARRSIEPELALCARRGALRPG